MADPASPVRSPGTMTLAAFFLLACLVPSQVALGAPVWALPVEHYPQLAVLLMATAVSMFAAAAPGRSDARRILVPAVVTLATFGAVWMFRDVRPELPFSRLLFLSTFALALGAVLALSVLPRPTRRRTAGAAGILALAMLPVGWATAPDNVIGDGDGDRTVVTAYHPVRIEYFDSVIPPGDVHPGGGIARVDSTWIAATGAGAFYRLDLDRAAGTVPVERLTIPDPRPAALLDSVADPLLRHDWFRINDISVEPAGESRRIWASHHHVDPGRSCVAMRLSSIAVDSLLRPTGPWRTRFTARPCLAITPDARGNLFAGMESGGRMAWLGPGRLLVTLGDHGHDGWNRPLAAAQADSLDYGKILLLDTERGSAEHFTRGHRNPQGLFQSPDGRIWSTEHGPMGGDELNLIERGGNYGWPYRTAGTEYGRLGWPIADDTLPLKGTVTGPVFAWVPSIGVSSLTGITGRMFTAWESDLLVTSLLSRSVYRVELAGSRVEHVEPIGIGRRIRDVVEDGRGRIWLWGETGDLVRLSVHEGLTRGDLAFGTCTGCHSTEGLSGGLGPDLRGVLGRRVAALDDFDYSPALQAVGGRWTRERLDAFLRDPAAFAPGTTMDFPGVEDPETRSALLDYLGHLR